METGHSKQAIDNVIDYREKVHLRDAYRLEKSANKTLDLLDKFLDDKDLRASLKEIAKLATEQQEQIANQIDELRKEAGRPSMADEFIADNCPPGFFDGLEDDPE